MTAIDEFFEQFPFVRIETLERLKKEVRDDRIAEVISLILNQRTGEAAEKLGKIQGELADALYFYLVFITYIAPLTASLRSNTFSSGALRTIFESSYFVPALSRLKKLASYRREVATRAADVTVATIVSLLEKMIEAVKIEIEMGGLTLHHHADILLGRIEPFLELVSTADLKVRFYDVWGSLYAVYGDSYEAFLKEEKAYGMLKESSSEYLQARVSNNFAVVLALNKDYKSALKVLDSAEVSSPIGDYNRAVILSRIDVNSSLEELKKLRDLFSRRMREEGPSKMTEIVLFSTVQAINLLKKEESPGLMLEYANGFLVLFPTAK